YPPEDLLFHRGLRRQVQAGLERLALEVPQIGIVVGYPEYEGGHIYNAARLLRGGRVLANYRKACLPNYKVFDEKRYFAAGGEACVVDFDGFRVGLLICEDLWESSPASAARDKGAEVLLAINASPYEIHKQREREAVVRERLEQVKLPVVYTNLVGGQDELVFDGNSFVLDAQGQLALRAPAFEESLTCVELVRTAGTSAVRPTPAGISEELSDEESVYR